MRWVTTLVLLGRATPSQERGIAPAARSTIAPVYRTIGLSASSAVIGRSA